jgi:hypothetical protein
MNLDKASRESKLVVSVTKEEAYALKKLAFEKSSPEIRITVSNLIRDLILDHLLAKKF